MYWRELSELVKALALPEDKDFASVECQGFSATVFRHLNSQKLELTDIQARRKIIELSDELKENSADCQRAPVVRNVKLGMAANQYKRLYPHAQMIRNRFDVGELVLRNIGDKDQRLKGIGALWTYFLDDTLYFVVIDYNNQIEWKDIDQFVEVFSKATGLRTKWEGYDENPTIRDFSKRRTLRCRNFLVEAEFIDNHPRVRLQDRAAVVKLNKREEQLKSPTNFRP